MNSIDSKVKNARIKKSGSKKHFGTDLIIHYPVKQQTNYLRASGLTEVKTGKQRFFIFETLQKL